MTNITLALSGGAARGAYHLGVLEYIDKKKIYIEAICATSIGSIIAASYLSGVTPREQLEIIKSKEFRSLFSFNYFRKSLFKIDLKHKLLDKLVKSKNIEDLKIPLYITAVDMKSGKNHYFDEGDIKTICQASSALIPLFPAVDYLEYKLIDGGTKNHMPIQPLKQYFCPMVGVNLHPIFQKNTNETIVGNIKRALLISMYGNSLENESACDVYITSDKLPKYSLFSFKHFDELFELGYADAKRELTKNLKR
ncbi:MAG: patatin-like phospholipase family protein [Sulfurospirillaceae bacterium]|nr:patatin-like phospholipase family protein [Sulfurospirillaceae bacterium]